MELRTGEQHNYPTEQATTLRFTVDALPKIDFAAKALHDAQARYFKLYPDTKKYAHALIWTINPAESYACPTCGDQHTHPLPAAECCDPAVD